MSISAVIRVREMLVIGTRFQIESCDYPLEPRFYGIHRVTEHLSHGIMSVAEDDPENIMLVPVGCMVGKTDAELEGVNGFVLFFANDPTGTRMHVVMEPTTFWSMILKPDGKWLRLEEGEDHGAMAGRLYDVITTPGQEAPRDAVVFAKDFILAHPEHYPLADLTT